MLAELVTISWGIVVNLQVKGDKKNFKLLAATVRTVGDRTKFLPRLLYRPGHRALLAWVENICHIERKRTRMREWKKAGRVVTDLVTVSGPDEQVAATMG